LSGVFWGLFYQNIRSDGRKIMKNYHRLIVILIMAFVLTLTLGANAKSMAAAGEEETIAGTVVKTDKGIIIEAEDGDYIVKGADLSKMVGKMVEATGIITESEKGDVIDVKTFEEIQE
jgi:hypothetical protein